MDHPVIRHLPLCNDLKGYISHMRYLDVWKGKVRNLNREYTQQWHLSDECYLVNKGSFTVNDRHLDLKTMIDAHRLVYNICTTVVYFISPNYIHARLFP